MNIGELFLCSRCMREIGEGSVCPYCGYDGEEKRNPLALEEGTLLQKGRFELGAVVGIGGFGITYAAWDHRLQIPAAVKEYFPRAFAERNSEESDEVLIKEGQQYAFQVGYDKFLQEAHLLGSLQNMSSIAVVRDWFEKNNTAYIAMEFIHGRPIDQYVKEHGISARQVLKMLQPTIQELGQIHQMGILHRDISPANLIVEDDGNIKLIDFGAAIDIGKRKDDEGNTMMYNPDFAAPEQYDPKGKIGPWTDVYEISAVIYYLITGRHVAEEKNIRRRLPIPEWQRRVLLRGLQSSTEARFQSMAEFYARLYDMPLPEEIQALEAKGRRQRLFILVGGLAALLLHLNFWYGLPVGGYQYQLSYDGFHVKGMTKKWMFDEIPEKLFFIPVTDIEGRAFDNRGAGKFTVPSWIRSVGDDTFYNSGFRFIELEDGVEYIGSDAFASVRNLRGIFIPESVKVIEDSAFFKAQDSLVIWGEHDSYAEQFAVAKGIPFAVKDEFVFDEDNLVLEKYFGHGGNIVVPSTFYDKYIYSISSDAFSECADIKSVVLPELLETVPERLLEGRQSLERVSIGYATYGIEEGAFADSGLVIVELPEYLAYIGEKAFYQCPLRSVELPKGLMAIEASAFQGTAIGEVVIPQMIELIGDSAFSDCTDLREVWILSQNCVIKESAFDGCPQELVIHGLKGSTAEGYAKEKGYRFEVLKGLE